MPEDDEDGNGWSDDDSSGKKKTKEDESGKSSCFNSEPNVFQIYIILDELIFAARQI